MSNGLTPEASMAALEERISGLVGTIQAGDERLSLRMDAGFKELSGKFDLLTSRLEAVAKSSGDGIKALTERVDKNEKDINALGDSHRRLRAKLVGDTPGEDGGLIATSQREHADYSEAIRDLKQLHADQVRQINLLRKAIYVIALLTATNMTPDALKTGLLKILGSFLGFGG